MRVPPRRRARSIAGPLFELLAWVVIAGLASVVVARAVAWDRWRIFADLDAAVEVLFLPAWLILVVAAVARRGLIAAAAALLCVAQVVYVAPELLASTPVPSAVDRESTIRLFDANVQQNNYSMAGYETQIRADRPDVVAIEESNAKAYGQFLSSGVFASLPYRFEIACCGSRGFIVASRYRIGHVAVASVDGLAYLLRMHLDLPWRTIDFWVVHTTAPVNPDWNAWNLELDGVAHALAADHPRPLLMVGDFNASWGNRGFRAVLATGLTDAAAARGDPFDFTWSQLLRPLPPLIRIDHVLTAGAVTVTTITSHDGPGSEHRDLTATVAVARAR